MATDLLSQFGLSNIKGQAYDIATYVLYGIVILAVALFAWFKYQDRKVYIYPVRIYRQRHHGMVKEINTFGGYVVKDKITSFMVKIGKIKKKKMDKLPLSEFMDEDNRIYYWQVSPDAPMIQVKREFVVETILKANEGFVEPSEQLRNEIIAKFLVDMKKADGYKDLSDEEQKVMAIQLANDYIESKRNTKIDVTKSVYSPVPTDLKQQALADIQSYKNTLGVDVNKQFAYFVIGVIALVIVGVIVFYIAVNKGDLPILTK